MSRTVPRSVVASLLVAGWVLLPSAPAHAQGAGCQGRPGTQTTSSASRTLLSRSNTSALTGMTQLQTAQALRTQLLTSRQQLRSLQMMTTQQTTPLTTAQLQAAQQVQTLRAGLQLLLLQQNGQLTPAQVQAFALQVQAVENVLQGVGQ